jgi:hypothetical protein
VAVASCAALLAMTGCAMFYVDHAGAERAERRRQDSQRALEGYYQKAVQAGTVEAAREFVTQTSIYASNAFKPSQVYCVG